MAKFLSTIVLDAAATIIRDNAQKTAVLSDIPSATTGAAGIADLESKTLAVTTLTTGASTSFAIANSSVSGRKITISEQVSIAVGATGVAAYVALYSSVSNVVYAYTSCSTQNLSDTANKVTIPEWIVRFADAT